MFETLKEKLLLPAIFAASVIVAGILGIFLFFNANPAWLKFFPLVMLVLGIVGGFALSFIPIFKDRKFIPVAAVAVSAVLTGIVIVVIL